MSSCLPVYTPSEPAPTYSSEPLPDEQRIQHTPRPHVPQPTGTFVKNFHHVTLILKNQVDGAAIPTYRRNGIVSGELQLEKSSEIVAVSLKILGRLDTTVSDGGSKTTYLVNEGCSLWTNEDSSDCPLVLPFHYVLPETYNDGGQFRPLPPSYSVTFPEPPCLFVHSHYTILFLITKSRPMWKRTKSLSVPVNYSPRTRPTRPILPHPRLLSAIKTMPEEWIQSLSKIEVRPGSIFESIDCHLFIPSVQIFALSDTIPFHIQLTGPASSLREFFSPTALECASTHSSIVSTKASSRPPPSPMIRVYILRQISAEVRGERACRSVVLGEGQVSPPDSDIGASVSSLQVCHDFKEHINWEGHVRCDSDVSTGGFNAGTVTVKDFIVLALSPPMPQTSPFLELQYAHPIRLVTDTWVDDAYGRDGSNSD